MSLRASPVPAPQYDSLHHILGVPLRSDDLVVLLELADSLEVLVWLGLQSRNPGLVRSSDVDIGGFGTIEYEEFLKKRRGLTRWRIVTPRMRPGRRSVGFGDDETGEISYENLKCVAEELSEQMADGG